MEELEGRWKLQHEKDDTFEKYLKAVGLMLPLRRMGSKATLVEDIRKVNDTKWSLSLSAVVRKSHVEFVLGEEVEETTLDGRTCKTTFKLENGELIQYQRPLQKGLPDTCVHRKRTDPQTVLQVGKRTTSWEEIKQDGENWSLAITSTLKNANLKFTMGQEFEEKTLDGRNVQSVFNIEGDKIVHYQKSSQVGIPDSVIVRERTDDNTLTVTFEAIGKSVKSVRKFSRQVR